MMTVTQELLVNTWFPTHIKSTPDSQPTLGQHLIPNPPKVNTWFPTHLSLTPDSQPTSGQHLIPNPP